MRHLLAAALFPFCLIGWSYCSSSLAKAAQVQPNEFYSLGFETIGIPVGRIVLFRGAREWCALKVNAYGKLSHENGEIKYAEYEIVRVPIAEKTIGTRKRIESGRLEFKGWVGIGHWAGKLGKGVLKCSGHRVSWSYPSDFGLNSDTEFYAAPTAWKNFSDVTADSGALIWYSEDKTQKRRSTKLPVDELVGYSSGVDKNSLSWLQPASEQ